MIGEEKSSWSWTTRPSLSLHYFVSDHGCHLHRCDHSASGDLDGLGDPDGHCDLDVLGDLDGLDGLDDLGYLFWSVLVYIDLPWSVSDRHRKA